MSISNRAVTKTVKEVFEWKPGSHFCLNTAVIPDPPSNVSVTAEEGYEKWLKITWNLPSSWKPQDKYYELIYEVKYRPLQSSFNQDQVNNLCYSFAANVSLGFPLCAINGDPPLLWTSEFRQKYKNSLPGTLTGTAIAAEASFILVVSSVLSNFRVNVRSMANKTNEENSDQWWCHVCTMCMASRQCLFNREQIYNFGSMAPNFATFRC